MQSVHGHHKLQIVNHWMYMKPFEIQIRNSQFLKKVSHSVTITCFVLFDEVLQLLKTQKFIKPDMFSESSGTRTELQFVIKLVWWFKDSLNNQLWVTSKPTPPLFATRVSELLWLLLFKKKLTFTISTLRQPSFTLIFMCQYSSSSH